MDYISLIQNRKSARAFMDLPVTDAQLESLKAYYETDCQRLDADIETELIISDGYIRADLDLVGAAGYEKHLIGAPKYFAILTEDKEGAIANAAYMAEDMILKLLEDGMGSCFLTFADGERIKYAMDVESDKIVAVLVAFGNEARVAKKMRFNAITMAKIGLSEKKKYHDPKKSVNELTYAGTYGNREGVDEMIGFYEDIIWESIYAASLSPSYLNRQPYAIILTGSSMVLVSTPDEFTDPVSEQQNLGIVMMHVQAVADQLIGSDVGWKAPVNVEALALPEGCKAVAELTL